MTPSAVSQQLSNLAKQLGVPLLEAQGRRVRLTDAAHLVLRHAEAVFAQLERAEAELTGYLRGEAGRCGSARSRRPCPPSSCRRSGSWAPTTGPDRPCGYGRRRPRRRTNSCRPATSISRSPSPRTRRPPMTPASPSSLCSPTRSMSPSPPDTGWRTPRGCGWPTSPPSRGSSAARALVGDHHGRMRGRRVRTRAGAQRLRVDRDPRHGRSGHGCRADPADGVGGAP